MRSRLLQVPMLPLGAYTTYFSLSGANRVNNKAETLPDPSLPSGLGGDGVRLMTPYLLNW